MSGVLVRLARTADAAAIAHLELAATAARAGRQLPAAPAVRADPGSGRRRLEALASRWAERLALPAGDDHFVLAAEGGGGAGPALAGFAAAGASRDDDGKGDGELYALAVAPGTAAAEVAEALALAVLDRLGGAGYARATCWLDPAGAGLEGQLAAAAALRHLGFTPDRTAVRRPGGLRDRFARRLPLKRRRGPCRPRAS